MKYGYDRDERELELIGAECAELSNEPLYIDHGTRHSKDKIYYIKGLGWNTKEWAKLFLKNWNRAVELWDNGHMFRVHVDEYQPYQLRDQQEYARICCSWIIIHGMVEPHVVAYEMPVNCSCNHCKAERTLDAFDESPDLTF